MHATPASWQTLQRIFLALGAVGLLISCAMTFKFGYAMSWLHAVALVTVTVMAAFIFPAKRFLREFGAIGPARIVGILGVFFIALEFYSHLGYTVGMRNKAILEATVQTAAYKNTQDALESEKTNLAFWRKQLTDLKQQNAWTATVTADGLRASLEAADKKIELETRRGGCKRKCLVLMEDKANLEARIATAEKVEDLSKRIEATQRILDGKTEKAVTVKAGFSAASAQTDWMGKIYLLGTGTDAKDALNPDDVTLTVTDIVIGFFIALGATMLPTTAFFFAFFGIKTEEPVSVSPLKPKIVATGASQPSGGVLHNHVSISDDRAIRELKEMLAKMKTAVQSALASA